MEVGEELVALRLLWDFMVYTFFETGLECTDSMEGGLSGRVRTGIVIKGIWRTVTEYCSGQILPRKWK